LEFVRSYNLRFGREDFHITLRRQDDILQVDYRDRDGKGEVYTVPWSRSFDAAYRSYTEVTSGLVRATISKPGIRERLRQRFLIYVSEMQEELGSEQ
jgi:hypothetical protein